MVVSGTPFQKSNYIKVRRSQNGVKTPSPTLDRRSPGADGSLKNPASV
jgi:hypothetical protein